MRFDRWRIERFWEVIYLKVSARRSALLTFDRTLIEGDSSGSSSRVMGRMTAPPTLWET